MRSYLFQNSINNRTDVRRLIKEGSSNADGFGETEDLKKVIHSNQQELKKQISTGQNKLAAYQKEMKSKIGAVKAGHSESEETITDIRSKNL